MPVKPPNPIDVHVGGRVRMRRIEVNMSQQALGGHIDLTFQQIQKYEKAMNRIGAGRRQPANLPLAGIPKLLSLKWTDHRSLLG